MASPIFLGLVLLKYKNPLYNQLHHFINVCQRNLCVKPSLKAEVLTMRRRGNCSTLFLSAMKSENYFIAPIISNTPILSLGSVFLSEDTVGLEGTLS